MALGSNLGDPRAQVLRAFEALQHLPGSRLVLRSALYRSPPFGPVAQPEFVNAVAGLLTTLEPRAMLAELKALEQSLGRETPVVRWGPRLIDLDLLVHGSARIDEPELQLPHPGIQRARVRAGAARRDRAGPRGTGRRAGEGARSTRGCLRTR